MKIIFADDHTLFRDALTHYILQADPTVEVLPAHDLHGVMEHLQTNNDVDLILLDLKMPGMSGLKGLEKTIALRPRVPVAIVSGLAEQADIEEALSIGARGYLPKTLPGTAVMQAIRKIVGGEIFVPVDHNTNMIMASHDHGVSSEQSRPDAPAIPEDKNLTPREREVLGYLMQGATNKDIARALDLQVVTVKLHVRGICRKLGATNRTQAVILAQQAAAAEHNHIH